MFTDWSEALEAESLPLDPTTEQQLAAAARATAHHSHDKHDLTLLLDALGLPTDPDTLTTLLPLLPETGDTPVTTTPAPPPAPALETTEPIDVPVIPLPGAHPVQELLDWATAHPAARVRNRAVRITADLAELTERRDTETAQREAEQKVAEARAEPERAQEELRTVKVGTRTVAAATVSTPIRAGAGSGRIREELAAIRAWARESGHQVADGGWGDGAQGCPGGIRCRAPGAGPEDRLPRGHRIAGLGRVPGRGDRARRPSRVDRTAPPHRLPHRRDGLALHRHRPGAGT
ncbi:hypothetical protein ABT007_27805 [Streptomyces griseus]|uniref:hypothetical protein n=1 Tax=Streptomyces griseus TaxID=1911 RepID=UPI00332AC8A9